MGEDLIKYAALGVGAFLLYDYVRPKSNGEKSTVDILVTDAASVAAIVSGAARTVSVPLDYGHTMADETQAFVSGQSTGVNQYVNWTKTTARQDIENILSGHGSDPTYGTPSNPIIVPQGVTSTPNAWHENDPPPFLDLTKLPLIGGWF